MAKKHSRVERKTTSTGIIITMIDNTIIKHYSRTHIVFMTFGTHTDAKKEFSRHRHGKKVL